MLRDVGVKSRLDGSPGAVVDLFNDGVDLVTVGSAALEKSHGVCNSGQLRFAVPWSSQSSGCTVELKAAASLTSERARRQHGVKQASGKSGLKSVAQQIISGFQRK